MQKINILINRYIQKQITKEELKELQHLLQDNSGFAYFDSAFNKLWNRSSLYEEELLNNSKIESILASIIEEKETPTYRLGVKKNMLWYSLAAATLLLLLGFSFLFLKNDSPKTNLQLGKSSINNSLMEVQNTNPILVLPSGKRLELSLEAKDSIFEESGVKISISKLGEIVYEKASSSTAAAQMHTLIVPKGGICKLKFSEGTEISLNSNSVLKYPASFFEKKNRKVELNGEAYFEVKKNEQKNFIVQAKNVKIKVLGTGFNLRAYKDENKVKTTLFHGNILIENKKNKVVARVKPGEQAIISDVESVEVLQTNVSQSVAWQKGEYVFNEQNIQEIMTQMARWYNIQVEYKQGSTSALFSGSLNKHEKFSDILEALEMTKDVSFKVNGNKITVYPAYKNTELNIN